MVSDFGYMRETLANEINVIWSFLALSGIIHFEL